MWVCPVYARSPAQRHHPFSVFCAAEIWNARPCRCAEAFYAREFVIKEQTEATSGRAHSFKPLVFEDDCLRLSVRDFTNLRGREVLRHRMTVCILGLLCFADELLMSNHFVPPLPPFTPHAFKNSFTPAAVTPLAPTLTTPCTVRSWSVVICTVIRPLPFGAF